MSFVDYCLVLCSWMPWPVLLLVVAVCFVSGIMLCFRIWKFILDLVPFA